MNRIKELRTARGIKQDSLAKQLDVTQANLSAWENNKWQPSNNDLIKLAEIFNVSVDYLLGRDVDRNISPVKFHRNVVKIKVLGSVPAGTPIDMVEDIIDEEEIPASWTSGNREYFGLRISGDSMMPDWKDKDIVIFRKQESCDNGQCCAVMVNGYEATFKKVIKSEFGITLQPLNPSYMPEFYNNEQIEKLPIVVLGVAIETRRKHQNV